MSMTKQRLRSELRAVKQEIRVAERVVFGDRGTRRAPEPAESAAAPLLSAWSVLGGVVGELGRRYTVVGVRDDESGRLTVAGVFPGELHPVDAEPGGGDARRWADWFTADGPAEAEALAHAAACVCEGSLDC